MYDGPTSPDVVPKPPLRGMPVRLLLEQGGPWEVLPEQVAAMTRAALAYLADHSNPADARQRVYNVWHEGHLLPAWVPTTPVASVDIPA